MAAQILSLGFAGLYGWNLSSSQDNRFSTVNKPRQRLHQSLKHQAGSRSTSNPGNHVQEFQDFLRYVDLQPGTSGGFCQDWRNGRRRSGHRGGVLACHAPIVSWSDKQSARSGKTSFRMSSPILFYRIPRVTEGDNLQPQRGAHPRGDAFRCGKGQVIDMSRHSAAPGDSVSTAHVPGRRAVAVIADAPPPPSHRLGTRPFEQSPPLTPLRSKQLRRHPISTDNACGFAPS